MRVARIVKDAFAGIPAMVNAAARLLWPPVCRVCGRGAEESAWLLCDQCWDELRQSTGGHACPRCGVRASAYVATSEGCSDCIGRGYHYEAIARAGVYGGALRRMIIDLKNMDRTDFEPQLRLLASAAMACAPFADQVDLLVPVPLHWTRRLARGFNHAVLIARSTGHHAPVCTDIVRLKRTMPQPGLSATERAANVRNAFAVRRRHPFMNKTVCLVDDVKTTGATLNECARTLKAAGATRVFAMVLAVVDQQDDAAL